MTSVHDAGRDALEVRTAIGQARSVGQNQQAPSITLEVGPRVERRLPGGIVLFLDGKAEASSLRGPGATGWSLPGVPSDIGGMVGITARTGLLR
ncbi:MAG: hypothetical protein EBZ59_11825 [Planctomycetia bacterium]|nr:hypothetical protein [Planctomycetia bacterium]